MGTMRRLAPSSKAGCGLSVGLLHAWMGANRVHRASNLPQWSESPGLADRRRLGRRFSESPSPQLPHLGCPSHDVRCCMLARRQYPDQRSLIRAQDLSKHRQQCITLVHPPAAPAPQLRTSPGVRPPKTPNSDTALLPPARHTGRYVHALPLPRRASPAIFGRDGP